MSDIKFIVMLDGGSMPFANIQEKLKTIPDEYMDDVYNYLDFLEHKILYKKMQKQDKKRFKNRKPGILKGIDFYMAPNFDEPLEDFKEYM